MGVVVDPAARYGAILPPKVENTDDAQIERIHPAVSRAAHPVVGPGGVAVVVVEFRPTEDC